MISPIVVEQKLTALEQKILGRLENITAQWGPVLAILLLGAFYHYIVFPLAMTPSPFGVRIDLFLDRRILYTSLCSGALFFYYFPTSWFGVLRYLTLTFSWVLACYWIMEPGWSMTAVPLCALGGYILLRYSQKSRFLALAGAPLFILFFLAVGYLLAHEAATNNNNQILKLFWILHPQMYLLFVVYWVLAVNLPKKEDFAFVPTNFAWSTLWPEETTFCLDKVEQKKLWWKGFWNCYTGAILFAIAFLEKNLLASLHVQGFGAILGHYTYFILFLVASFSQLVGMSRLFGVNCPDPTYFMVLAKTPMETWQRGSTYTYRFFFRHIYLPLYRLFRNYALAVLASFVLVITHMMLFQEIFIRSFYAVLVPELRAPPLNLLSNLLYSASWSGLWLVLIIVGASLWSNLLKRYPHPIFQWVSIVANHLLIAMILPVVEIYLYPYFLRIAS